MNLFSEKDSLTSLNLNSDNFFLPYLSKINCSWYYQKYPINLTDNNDLVIVKIATKLVFKMSKSCLLWSEKWQSFVNKYSSDELVDILLNEFIGGNDQTNVKHLLEFDKNTYENMKLCNRDVLLIIYEILTERFQSITKSEFKEFIQGYFCNLSLFELLIL